MDNEILARVHHWANTPQPVSDSGLIYLDEDEYAEMQHDVRLLLQHIQDLDTNGSK